MSQSQLFERASASALGDIYQKESLATYSDNNNFKMNKISIIKRPLIVKGQKTTTGWTKKAGDLSGSGFISPTSRLQLKGEKQVLNK